MQIFDVETGAITSVLHTANEAAWTNVEAEEAAGNWTTMIGLDVVPSLGMVVAGDSKGGVHFLDPRSDRGAVASLPLHKRGCKVQSVACNPADNNLLLTAGNDHKARLMDVRCLSGGAAGPSTPPGPSQQAMQGCGAGNAASAVELAVLDHTRVVNSASFSPLTGRKIMTSCQDNRIRIWDLIQLAGGPPSREIVHSHNFSRHLTAFKAEWDPKDPGERLIGIGRYISEVRGRLEQCFVPSFFLSFFLSSLSAHRNMVPLWNQKNIVLCGFSVSFFSSSQTSI
jgi:DNA damage-binding protein 2